MKIASLAILALSATLAGANTPLQARTQLQVAIADGRIQGVETDGVVAFKGIPFAAPPVGDLRWRAPQPVRPWAELKQATDYGADCMQVLGAPMPATAKVSEDCLFANVWRAADATGKTPILLWIFGGGFVVGGSSPTIYTGDAMARQGVMFISFNYRVGRFGTFGHPQLTAANADKGLEVNYGLMDILAMLRWVKRNAAAFGGDPDNVTIVGESAGASAVHMLLGSPMAKGLFKRAIIQSSGIGMPAWSTDGATIARAEAAGVNFAKAKGIAENDPQALAKLRALPATEVVDGLSMTSSAAAQAEPRTYTLPIVDGIINVDAPVRYRAGTWNKVPVMVGATSNDMGGPDGYMIHGARAMADLFSSQGVPTYYYRFSYVADSQRKPDTVGAIHGSDIAFFFDTVDNRYAPATTAKDRGVGRIMSRYMANFVKTGNPNGPGLGDWEPHIPSAPVMINFTAEGGAQLQRNPTP
ncbi:carboxylesterase family protein [Sphingobium sp. H39-3-25]|uniref:carboxylesterase/lipase family protein n=1 Tax=Sphingobium arseniciresistens TaxID=3030834 RepID=UPI0023B98606|nr:carboxylesterase family protein [Sphingobium arseniciresistens]